MEKVNIMKAGSLCAGIGGFEHKSPDGVEFVWANDMETWVCDTYSHNYPDTKLFRGGMESIDEFPQVDLVVAGFPCQPFSLAGKKMGFNDLRGQVIFHILKVVEHIQPSLVILENVKNLTSKKYSEWMETILGRFSELGYQNKWQILNTADVTDIPQNRERVYIVLSKIGGLEEFNFPSTEITSTDIIDLLEDSGDFKFYGPDTKVGKHLYNIEIPDPNTVYQWRRAYVRTNKKRQCPTLTKNMGTGGHNVPIVYHKGKFRKLTVRECLRLQGFDDSFEFAPNASRARQFQMVGNAVTCDVAAKVVNEAYRIFNLKRP